MIKKDLKVAIVHDWLVGGGAELVVLELHKMFPQAPIYTSYCTDEWRQKLDNKVVTGWLQNWPFSRLRKFIPILRIWWFTHLDLSDYDLVISSSGNGEAKGIRVSKATKHVCYCHTSTHFYWRHHNQYVRHPGFGPFAGLALRLLVGPLRKWDLKASKRPDFYIANSEHIKGDIKKYYGRDAVVVHPPVDTDLFAKFSALKRHGFVTVGRQVPYKKVSIIVEACSKLNLQLTVIGNGPEHNKLVKLAGSSVTFINSASIETVSKQLAQSQAFILAAFEDFGITPVEAMAAGTPVIAFKAGGALDYVIEGKTGLFFDKQTSKSLCEALERFDSAKFSGKEIQSQAAKFSKEHFHQHILDYLGKIML